MIMQPIYQYGIFSEGFHGIFTIEIAIQRRTPFINPKYAMFKDWLKEGAELHEHQGHRNLLQSAG